MKPTPMLRQAVAEYRAGRQEAFTTLYEESSKYLYVCIREVVGRNDNAEDIISDIMQDTYVEISRSIGQLRDEDTFLTWAGKIASNKCYRWLMKNKREVLLNENDTTFENLADNDNIIPEEVLQSREKQRLVRQIIDTQLTEMQKLCIVAYYYNEQKQSEIAQELGIPENTVKTNLSRAKAKIKEGVLDIEKKQGTKLYSVAPLLLFLLGEEVSACTVPQSVTTKVSIAVSSAAKEIGKKTLWGKLVSASTKTKIIAGIVSAAAAVAVGSAMGTAVFMVTQERNNTVEIPAMVEREEAETQEEVETQEEAETQEAAISEAEITLSDKEQEDLKVLASMLTLNSYFFGDDMYGYHYPVSDIAADIKVIGIIGSQWCQGESSYTKYLPLTDIDDATYIRYCDKDDVRVYLQNVFGIEAADISAYCEGDRVVFDLIADFVLPEAVIDNAAMISDGTYRIEGKFVLWYTSDIVEVMYPYELTVIKNDTSPFGFQVISMDFGEELTEDYEQAEQITTGDVSLSDILLNPEGNSAYYPRGVEYNGLYFALIDIDKDGEDEILLGTSDTTDYFGNPIWMTIFNVLKYDRNSGAVTDFDGDNVYKPLDANSWHYYDTGVLMTMVEAGEGHTNFWNLLTGEFIDAALWVRDDPNKGPDSEGHSKIYNDDGTEITGTEADQYYQSLKSGNEIPIVWCEVNLANIQALIPGESVAAVNISTPYGRYQSSRGSEFNFLSDTRVQVSEGNVSHVYEYTIDSAGNIVIDPANEAVEGTYNSAADELSFYGTKYRR